MKRKLKNIANIFKPYKNPYLSLEKRLIGPDKKSNRFLEYLEEVKGYNFLQAYMHPLKVFYVTPKSGKSDYLNHHIVTFINNFTMHNSTTDENLDTFRDLLLKYYPDQIEDIEYNDRDFCTIKYKNGKIIEFSTITDSFDFNSELDDFKNELLTTERQGKCHARSILLAHTMSDPDCHVTTGSVYDLNPRGKFLHSWVELETENGSIYCIDNNWNAVLTKEDYYFLQHPKIVERISKKRIEQDIEKIALLNEKTSKKTPYMKLYVTSPDEAIEKYHELIEKEDSQEM